MKNILSFLAIMSVVATANAAESARRSMTQTWASAPRATASVGQLNAMGGITTNKSTTQPIVAPEPIPVPIKNRDAEKQACINNNVGVGNTFVWASRSSNTSNYATMVEDTENPDNNVCFVRVELKSNNAKVNISDVKSVYYPMGQTITCGAWADEGQMNDRILAAGKSARTWGTVAGVVGGVGVGVGAMELFGNNLIGGAVEGQRDLSNSQLLRSHMMELARTNQTSELNAIKADLRGLKEGCDTLESDKPDDCNTYDYESLLRIGG